jgi:hypothetical protein
VSFMHHFDSNRNNITSLLIRRQPGDSCFSIFSFICMFCRSLFVLLYFFFWPLCCLFFFDLRIMITHLVSLSWSTHIYWSLLRNHMGWSTHIYWSLLRNHMGWSTHIYWSLLRKQIGHSTFRHMIP